MVIKRSEYTMKRYLPILVIFTLFTIMLVGCTNGNSNGNISVYTRDTSSGTREAFFEAIGFSDASTDDGALVSDALIVESNGDMINKIRNDQNGIGYISLSSLASSNLKGLTFDGVEATEANVLNGTYALKRPFNYIVTSNSQTSADQLAHAF